MWSRDYLFFKKYSRSIQSIMFFKSNYISLHLTLFKTLNVHELPNFRLGFNSFLTNNTFHYILKAKNNTFLPYVSFFREKL